MSIIDDIKQKADTNGDGNLSMEDLKHLKQEHPEMSTKFEELKQKAAGQDGKLDFNDVKTHISGLGGKIKGMFN